MTVEQARAQYETAAAQIPQIEQQIAVTENALSILLGRNPGPDSARQVDRRRRRAVDSRRTAVAICSSAGPTSLQAEQKLIAANAQIGAAKALYFPTISLTGRSAAPAPTCPICSRVRRRRGTTPARSPGRSSPAGGSRVRSRRRGGAEGGAASPTKRRSRTPSPTSTTRCRRGRRSAISSPRRSSW